MLKQWQFTKRKHNSLSRKRGSFGYSQLTYMIPDQVDPLSFLTEKALEFAKRYLKKNEPFTYKELPILKVRGDDINLQVRIKDLSVASGATFRTDDIITDPERMSIRFRIIFPQIIIAGRYSVSGKEEGKKVSSKGQFRIGLYNSKVTGRLSLLIIEGKIYIKRFDMDYFINNNLKFRWNS
ncbi:uncharacterized protein LOC106665602 isoform X2 [Cimex lectularius]|uniref:Uncharacterized protein n=1 Tax=Cimex lectularius TaxID=79782 RepID=A0A8I6RLJ3_CIMLE|nr:uncharacterized protein LOC106665602 isoform X2 [Cimex lectularius]